VIYCCRKQKGKTMAQMSGVLKDHSPLPFIEIFWRIVSPLLCVAAAGMFIRQVWLCVAGEIPLPPGIAIAVMYCVMALFFWATRPPGWRETIKDFGYRNTVRYWAVFKRFTGSDSWTRDIMTTPGVNGICEIHGTTYFALPLSSGRTDLRGFAVADPDRTPELHGVRIGIGQNQRLKDWHFELVEGNELDYGMTVVRMRHWKETEGCVMTLCEAYEFAVSGVADRVSATGIGGCLAYMIRQYRTAARMSKAS
jgi:hypothetical protein